jgi:hypothetical protein
MKFEEFIKLKEAISQDITRLAVFDFDGTLVFTPTPEQGIPKYEKETGKPWYIRSNQTALDHGFDKGFRRLGWWGRPESLHPPIFNSEPEHLNHSVANALRTFKNDPQTYVVLMTGRGANLGNRVKEILNQYSIHVDEYFFRNQKDLVQHPGYPSKGDTFDYKAFTIINRLMTPNIKSVEIFEDREEHVAKFLQFGKNLKKNFPNLQSIVIHDVERNKNFSA